MRIILEPDQEKAVEKLGNGKILCGGVGSGKSITSLAYFFTKVCNGKLTEDGEVILPTSSIPLYIITTAKKRDTLDWNAECARWGMLTTEESPIKLTIDSWNNIKKYQSVYGSFFIFDEQHVTGRGAWVKSFLHISRRNKWILLSATPGDVWLDYIPVFIANGFYKSRHEFEERHVVYNRYSKYPKVDDYRGTAVLVARLNSILVPMECKKNAIRHDVYITTEYDKSVYNYIKENRCYNTGEEIVPIKNNTEFCLMLRKVSNVDTSKLAALSLIFLQKHRLIIYYMFNYELEILKTWALSRNIQCAEYNGRKHDKLPEGEEWVYLNEYAASNEAWECYTTDTIVFFSPNYSFKILEQCRGRIDRRYTKYKDLYYYHLISNSGIDKAIRKANESKRIFNENNFLRAKNTH